MLRFARPLVRVAPILVAAALIGATPAPSQDRSDDAAVTALDSLWARAYASHDTAAALALFDPRLVMTTSSGTLKTRDQELADVRPQPGVRMQYFRTTGVHVRTWGDAAVVTGRAEWAFTYAGKDQTSRRRYTAVYVRGGPLGWKMTALHMGPAPAAQP